jgi:DNA integrity scanning protein DisA with diadenylate cyclase activity/mannitol/fructose-specific phosphotransferase system IIA component (Ntr-type)
VRLDRYFSRDRVVELEATDLRGALRELLAPMAGRFSDLRPELLLEKLIEREHTITTFLGNGVALPHVRVRSRRPYVIAVGRSRKGITYNSLNGVEQVHLLIVLIASDKARDYLQALASIARFVRERELVDALLAAPDLDTLAERFKTGMRGMLHRKQRSEKSRFNRMMLRQAAQIARGADCAAAMVFADTLSSSPSGFAEWFGNLRTIVVTGRPLEGREVEGIDATLQVRSFSRRRLSQLRSALLVAMTRRVVEFRDRILCIGGTEGSDLFDTVMVIDVEREFSNLLTDPSNLLPNGVNPEVFERIVAVATELSVEGREGRPVGAIFVIGDHTRVEQRTKPLVLNPFFGYKDEDRSVLNPFMDETLKEFSLLDGAFVIRGDGVVLSAGSLILSDDSTRLPSGLGARHAAAAAISHDTDCVAVVVSSSTGQVAVFRRGLMVPLIEKLAGER